MRRVLATFSSATTCCCPQCLRHPVRATPHTSLAPHVMQIALRRRLRLPMPLAPVTAVRLAAGSVRTHLVTTPWRALGGACSPDEQKSSRAWCGVAREAAGPEGHVVPQQWLAHATAPGIASDDRRRLDLVIYGATPLGGAICCDATLVSPLRRDGTPACWGPCSGWGRVASGRVRKRATYPELAHARPRGAQSLCVLGCEIGGRWNASAMLLVRRLVARRAPPAVRGPARAAWARRWWSVLSAAVQKAIGHTALGRARAVPGPAQSRVPALDEVLALAPADSVSRLPLR